MAGKASKRPALPEVVKLADSGYGMLRNASSLTLSNVRFIWGYDLNGLHGQGRGWVLAWYEGSTDPSTSEFKVLSSNVKTHLILPCERFNAKDEARVGEKVLTILIPIINDLLSQVSKPLL